jgi:hypothetical protein
VFGRRKTPFGGPPSPPPPGGKDPYPIDKMDSALDGAIRLFTRALDHAGVDAGRLAVRGAVPARVTAALADCTSYRGEDDGGLTYLVLGLTSDFKAFTYQPHCRLFLIINSTGICEDPAAAGILDQVAPDQFPSPLLDAHLMRRWIRYILDVPPALRAGASAIEALHRRLMDDLIEVISSAPPAISGKVQARSHFDDWSAGLPAAIGRPLTADVPRMNHLPMTPFIENTLIQFLAEVQASGLAERRRA